MRDELFEEKLLKLGVALHKRVAESQTKPSEGEDSLVILGLSLKGLSHCEMAVNLIGANASSEAMIILRAAYEAVIRAIFLDENRLSIPFYRAFADLAILRNQLEIIKVLKEFDEPEEVWNEQMEKVKEQQEKIVRSSYHKLFDLDQTDLDEWKKLKKITNNANLPTFETIRQSVKKTKLVKALLTTGFQVYNVGSQMAHSSFNMVTTMAYFRGENPLYAERAMYRQVLLLLQCITEMFGKHAVLTAEEVREFTVYSQEICFSHLDVNG